MPARADLARPGPAAPVLPARGLPEHLPKGERLLWQGAPNTRALLRHTFHVRAMAVYFGVILAWCAATILSHGGSAHVVRMSLMHRAELAAVPFLLVAVYAWAIQRSTVYSITDRRVVISFGMALPVTFNLPFSKIEAAGLRLHGDGSGDIPLRLLPHEKMSYFVVWPHARPWRMARTEPMLRCVADAQAVSAILGAALAEQEALAQDAASGEARLGGVSVSGKLAALKPVRMPSAFGVRGPAVAAE